MKKGGSVAKPLSAKITGADAPLGNDFSLVLGGPLYQLFLRTNLTRSTMELLHRRIIAFAVISWVPLALLSAISGTFGGGVSVPFIYDIDAHVRFLVSIPILVAAELIVHRRARTIVEQFLDHEIIPPESISAFQEIIRRAMQLRNSVLSGIGLRLISLALVSDSSVPKNNHP